METESMIADPLFLENHRVLLKPLSTEDLDVLLPVALEKELWEMGLVQIDSRQALAGYIEEALWQKSQGKAYPFVIIDKLNGKVMGSTRYADITKAHHRLQIGFTWLSKEARGTGLNKACKFALLQHAFETLRVTRVEFFVDALNVRSRAAVRKMGAKEEGLLRSHMVTYSGRVRDTAVYSILSSEWTHLRLQNFEEFNF